MIKTKKIVAFLLSLPARSKFWSKRTLGMFTTIQVVRMRWSFVGNLITVLGVICISFSGSAYALPGQTCPKGTAPNQDLGTCAQCTNTDCVGSNGTDPAAGNCSEASCDLIKTYVDPLITLLAALVGVSCVISIIMAGIQYTTSAGDPQKASAAKNRIMNAVIALLAFAFLYAFLEFIIPGGVINPGS